MALTDGLETGYSTKNYFYMRCWIVLNLDGKKVFQHIFNWGFGRPSSIVKDALFQLPNYSNTKYRSDFNASQRKLIDDGRDIDEYDLGLLYLLLQRVCSLPPMSDKQWGPAGDPNSLPNILYQIKMKRNNLAHSNVEMYEVEMTQSLTLYQNLFNNALGLAASKYNISDDALKLVQEEITAHILTVLTTSDVIIKENIKEIIVKEENNIDLDDEELRLAKAFKDVFKVILFQEKIIKDYKGPIIERSEHVIHHIKPVFDEIGKVVIEANIVCGEKMEDIKVAIENTNQFIKEYSTGIVDQGIEQITPVIEKVEEVSKHIEPVIHKVIEDAKPAIENVAKDVGKFFGF